MDILTALTESRPERGTKRCKLQQHIDNIPTDTPGREALIDAVNGTLAQRKVAVVFAKLGMHVSTTLVQEHRANECVCYR